MKFHVRINCSELSKRPLSIKTTNEGIYLIEDQLDRKLFGNYNEGFIVEAESIEEIKNKYSTDPVLLLITESFYEDDPVGPYIPWERRSKSQKLGT